MLKKYLLPEMGAKITEKPPVVKFPNGSKIELIGVQNAESLRGAAVNFMILDEYADFSRNIWTKVLEPMLITTKGDVWFVGTPKGMGNDLYDKFFSNDKDITKSRIPACKMDGDKVISTTSQFASIETIQKSYDQSPKDAFDQEYLAEFTRPSGTVYSDWPLENYRSCPYDLNLEMHYAFDYGVNDPTSIIFIQPMGSEYRVVDYWEKADANIDTHVAFIRSVPYKESSFNAGDPAGEAKSITTNTSPAEEFRKRGIFIRSKNGVKIPDQIRAVHAFIKSLIVNSDNPRCARFRDCLLNYRYPEIKDTARNQENEIPIHDEFSHAMRALEYYAVNVKDIANNKKRQPIVGFTGGDPITGFGRRPIRKKGRGIDFLE